MVPRYCASKAAMESRSLPLGDCADRSLPPAVSAASGESVADVGRFSRWIPPWGTSEGDSITFSGIGIVFLYLV